jgi:hypothetical protein
MDTRPRLRFDYNWKPPAEDIPLSEIAMPYVKMREALDMAIERMLAASDERTQQIGRIIPTLLHSQSAMFRAVFVRHDCYGGSWIMWNPEFLDSRPVDEIAYAICHEGAHVLLDWKSQVKQLCGDNPDAEQLACLNIAADLEIEQLLAEIRDIRPEYVFRIDKWQSCPVTQLGFNVMPGKDTKWYYEGFWYKAQKHPTPVRDAINRMKAEQGQ